MRYFNRLVFCSDIERTKKVSFYFVIKRRNSHNQQNPQYLMFSQLISINSPSCTKILFFTMIIERKKQIDFVVNFTIVVVCIVHISLTGYKVLFPDLPSIRIQDKSLKDIDFPLFIQMCVSEIEKSHIFTKLGYKHEIAFYFGQSAYNDSLFGWNGHLPNGSTIGTLEGIKNNIRILVINAQTV